GAASEGVRWPTSGPRRPLLSWLGSAFFAACERPRRLSRAGSAPPLGITAVVDIIPSAWPSESGPRSRAHLSCIAVSRAGPDLPGLSGRVRDVGALPGRLGYFVLAALGTPSASWTASPTMWPSPGPSALPDSGEAADAGAASAAASPNAVTATAVL